MQRLYPDPEPTLMRALVLVLLLLTAAPAVYSVELARTASHRSDPSDKSDRSDPSDKIQSTAACQSQLLHQLSTFAKSPSRLERNERILIAASPLHGTFGRSAFPAAAKKVASALSRYGTTTILPCDSLLQALADSSARYMIACSEVQAKAHETRLRVGSFAKLNRNGEFVTTHDTTTITSYDTIVSVHFIAADMKSRTVVFDRWEADTLKAPAMEPDRPKPGRDRVKGSVLKLAARIGAELRKEG